MHNTQSKPTVYIVDDDDSLCKSVTYLLESINLTVSSYSNAHAFLDICNPKMLGCVLLDVRMPDMSGLQVQDTLSQRGIYIPILFMTGHGDIEMAVRAVKKGAIDFLTKPFNHQRLLDNILYAIELSKQYLKQKKYSDQITETIQALSNREYDVLKNLVQGKSNKDIARDIGLSSKTIEYYRPRIMKKLSVQSIPELVRIVDEYEKLIH